MLRFAVIQTPVLPGLPNHSQMKFMPVTTILHYEGWGFICVIGAMVAYRMLTRQIDIGGIFGNKDGSPGASPERIQLFLATLSLGATYLGEVAKTTSAKMPDVSKEWLVVFGASSGLYVSVKGLKTFLKGR
jgi:hypothetical protein